MLVVAVGRFGIDGVTGGAFVFGVPGAGAIWSMHFIGMLAFDMGMPVAYDVPVHEVPSFSWYLFQFWHPQRPLP